MRTIVYLISSQIQLSWPSEALIKTEDVLPARLGVSVLVAAACWCLLPRAQTRAVLSTLSLRKIS